MTAQEQEDHEVRGKMEEMAHFVKKELPLGWGFVVLAFPFGSSGRFNYVANAERGDVVRSMYEFIEATKQQFGEHVTETEGALYDEQMGRFKQRVAYLEGLMLGIVRDGEIGRERFLGEIERLIGRETGPGQGKS